MNIANWLYQTALSWPNRPALYEGDVLRQSYAELLQTTCNRAAWLREEYGILAGDRVAVFAKNAPEYIEVLHACWWLGAVVVPINCKLHPREAEWIIRDAEAALVFTESGAVFSDKADIQEVALCTDAAQDQKISAPVPVEDQDLAWLFYTSGTTGTPKGVMLSHENVRQMTLCYALDVDCAQAEDHMLYAAPMSHGAGLYMFAHIRAGGAHLIPASHGFDSDEIIGLARTRGNLVFFAAPTMVKRLIAASKAQGFTGEGIRTIIYGGGPMYANDINEALACYGPRFVQIYGQGETPMTISVLGRDLVADQTHPRWQARRASVGIAQGAVTLAVLGSDGTPLPAGATGEICVKGPTVMKGYWKNAEASEQALAGGWLHTGDLGHLDEDGFLYLTDRSKDVIISGGTNIYPREVEEALLCHPSVFEVAVIGVPEPDWGEQVVAYVVFEQGKSASVPELDSWCRQHIAAFKRPKHYEFVKELPKNSYGKVLKTELRSQACSKTASA
ncbi:class I adenylate-forming enzyme family protein [Celeribacter halophilus]|uniref:class I adenylate-forming enzyme family protein n=1 Tax=Celeribacter halophilus TaxID=576117 RepID=UPI001C08F896|nr:AMP-binding protein [Celeribacter halophilus]MBU2890131.1 AMP-binding protein [Celeribacter halophilus]MDO6511258.1 AMP-binding protein [Celeribacter halophilus]